MQNNTRSVSLNGNSSPSGVTLSHAKGGRQALAGQPRQREGVGTGGKQTGCAKAGTHPADNRRSLGGQASLRLFGIAGATGSKAAEGKAPPRPPHRSRIKGALNSFDTDGLSPAHYAPAAAPSPIQVTLPRERMAVFATVATHEARPLPDVLSEALSEQADRWSRTRHTLHLDPRDRALLDAYLDSLALDPDRLERMEDEAAYRAATTPAMQAAARAADEREAFVPEDREEWDRALPFGHVEIAIACD